MGIKEACSEIVKITREKSPLVHNMTNYVTVNDCANACLLYTSLNKLIEISKMV